MKTNKVPKVRNDHNQINLISEELGENYKQNQFEKYNLDNGFSPERRKNDYFSPEKVFVSPSKVRPPNNSYDKQ